MSNTTRRAVTALVIVASLGLTGLAGAALQSAAPAPGGITWAGP